MIKSKALSKDFIKLAVGGIAAVVIIVSCMGVNWFLSQGKCPTIAPSAEFTFEQAKGDTKSSGLSQANGTYYFKWIKGEKNTEYQKRSVAKAILDPFDILFTTKHLAWTCVTAFCILPELVVFYLLPSVCFFLFYHPRGMFFEVGESK